MYIHIGSDTTIKFSDLIGIFDIETTSISKITKFFLFENEKKNRIVNICSDIPKSFIITNHKGVTTIYISQISSQTIKKRFLSI